MSDTPEIEPWRRTFSTRTRLRNGHYPTMWTRWTQDADQMGWKGTLHFWLDGDTEIGKEHTLNVRMGNPLGSLSMYVDDMGYGCHTMGQIEGVGITERDLQWASAWASAALQPEFCQYECAHKAEQEK